MQNVAILVSIFIMMANPAVAAEKLSLKQIGKDLKASSAINNLYKNSQDLEKNPAKELKSLAKKNQSLQNKFFKHIGKSGNFIRGEIEDEKTLSAIVDLLHLSMLQARAASFESHWNEVKDQFQPWFQFAADFAYEESSLIGLRTAGVLRSILLDNLEALQSKFSAEMAESDALREWFLKVPAPWPVDRVLISEAKRFLNPLLMPLAEKAAAAYQKNPYQTVEQSLKNAKGSEATEARLLKEAWREKDIDILKTEVTRIGKLKLRLAVAAFEKKNQKKPESVQDLVSAHLMEQVPIDYFSGKALDLTSL
jgi:hypothetical protein